MVQGGYHCLPSCCRDSSGNLLFTFKTEEELNQHRLTAHKETFDKYYCKNCNIQ